MRTTKSNRTAVYYRRVSPDMVKVLDGVLFGGAAITGHGYVDEAAAEIKRLNDDLLVVDAGRADLRAENEFLRAENERLMASGVGVDGKLEAELKKCRAKIKEYESMYNGS